MNGKNKEGYRDPTACAAIVKTDREIELEREREKRLHERQRLVDQWNEAEQKKKLTLKEKDLFRLKYVMLGIMPGSLQQKEGCIGALRRAIHRLEREGNHDSGSDRRDRKEDSKRSGK